MTDPQFRTEDGSAVRIWAGTEKNNFASEKNGRPIFDECIFVEVISPGSKGSTPVFLVERVFHESVGHEPQRSPQYETFRTQIEKFRSGEELRGMGGTPLTEWPEIGRSLAASLAAQNIFTVEALANLPDTRLQAVGMDARTWVKKAQAWLDAANNGSANTQLVAEHERALAEIEVLKQQVAELAAKLQEATADKNAAPAPAPAPAPATAPATAPAPIANLV